LYVYRARPILQSKIKALVISLAFLHNRYRHMHKIIHSNVLYELNIPKPF